MALPSIDLAQSPVAARAGEYQPDFLKLLEHIKALFDSTGNQPDLIEAWGDALCAVMPLVSLLTAEENAVRHGGVSRRDGHVEESRLQPVFTCCRRRSGRRCLGCK
jgi:hypothetical protein